VTKEEHRQEWITFVRKWNGELPIRTDKEYAALLRKEKRDIARLLRKSR